MKGFPFQYFGFENSTDCIVYGVTKSQTQLSDFHIISALIGFLEEQAYNEDLEESVEFQKLFQGHPGHEVHRCILFGLLSIL